MLLILSLSWDLFIPILGFYFSESSEISFLAMPEPEIYLLCALLCSLLWELFLF